MKFLSGSLVLMTFIVSPMAAIDAELVKYLGSDTKELVGVYVDRAASSPLGTFLQQHAGMDGRALQGFITATGFDPRTHIKEAIVSSSGDTRMKTGLVVARGVYNGTLIGTTALDMGGSKQSYSGVDVYLAPGREGAFAFPEPSIGIFGEEALVKAALDRRTTPAALDPKLLDKATAASSRFDVWFAATGRPSFRLGKTSIAPESLEVVSGGATLGSVVHLTAEAVMKTAKDAQALADLIRFVSGLAELQQQNRPEIAPAMTFVRNAETRVEGVTVSVSTSAPQADIEKLLGGARTRARLR